MTKKTSPQPATPQAAPATKPFPLPVDEYHGVGGEYVLEDGVRRRVGASTPASPVVPPSTVA